MKLTWSKEIEEQIIYIGNCSQGYVWMYKKQVEKLYNLSWYLSNLSICLGVISGGLSGLSLGLKDNDVLIGFSTGFAFSSAITQGLLKKFDFETRIAEYKRQIAKYSGISNNITKQLSLPSNKREKAEDYYGWISKNYTDLTENSLDIREKISKEYQIVCKEKNIPYPGDIKEIKIYEEKNGEKEEQGEKGGTLKKFENALLFSDVNMKYEMNRLKEHGND